MLQRRHSIVFSLHWLLKGLLHGGILKSVDLTNGL